MCILLKLDDTEFGVSNLCFSKVVKEKPLGGAQSPPFGKGRVNVFLLGLPSQGMNTLMIFFFKGFHIL